MREYKDMALTRLWEGVDTLHCTSQVTKNTLSNYLQSLQTGRNYI